jgi:hypothetical protein
MSRGGWVGGGRQFYANNEVNKLAEMYNYKLHCMSLDLTSPHLQPSLHHHCVYSIYSVHIMLASATYIMPASATLYQLQPLDASLT